MRVDMRPCRRLLQLAGGACLADIVLFANSLYFAGSLYLMASAPVLALVWVTPLGGAALPAG